MSYGTQLIQNADYMGTQLSKTNQALDSIHQFNPPNVEHSYNDNEGLLARDYYKAQQLPTEQNNYSGYRRNESSQSYELEARQQPLDDQQNDEILTPMNVKEPNDQLQPENNGNRMLPQPMLMKNSLCDIDLDQKNPNQMDYQFYQDFNMNKNRSSS